MRARAKTPQLHDMGDFDPATGVLVLRHGERTEWTHLGGGQWERTDARAPSDDGRRRVVDVRGGE